jgi:hypothetical protein
MSALLPDIYTHDGLVAIQKRLLAKARGTDDSVRACTGLDATTRAAWGSFYIQVVDFANTDFGYFFFGSTVDHAKALEQEVYDWDTKLALKCQLALPVTDPSKLPGGSQQPTSPTLDALGSMVKWLAIGAVAVGGAYVVGKAISLIPPPARRA